MAGVSDVMASSSTTIGNIGPITHCSRSEIGTLSSKIIVRAPQETSTHEKRECLLCRNVTI